jgi:hypothetical protein
VTDALTAEIEIVRLEVLGDPNADACEGEFCEIPDHHTQAVINRKVDDDAI